MINKIENYINDPWKIDTPFGADYPTLRDKDGRRIAVIASTWPSGPKTEDIQASLICAAPELYKALRDLLSRIANDKDAHAWFSDEQEAAIKALSKARGED
jgi:hypothetical protein